MIASDDWIARDAAVVWHGFTQMAAYADNRPVIVERAEGHELIDVDGRRYLDAISSVWVTTLGHHHPELDAALREQLDLVAHSTMLGNGNRAVIELAEALAPSCRSTTRTSCSPPTARPRSSRRSRSPSSTGPTSASTGRTRYLAFGGAYHGDTIGSLSVGAGGFGTDLYDPLRFPVLRAPAFDDPRCFDEAVALIARTPPSSPPWSSSRSCRGAAGMLVGDPAKCALGAACARTTCC